MSLYDFTYEGKISCSELSWMEDRKKTSKYLWYFFPDNSNVFKHHFQFSIFKKAPPSFAILPVFKDYVYQ